MSISGKIGMRKTMEYVSIVSEIFVRPWAVGLTPFGHDDVIE